ncbi:MAG: Na/Pi cotransporter family protein [Bacteroidia bacterium]
MTSIDFWRFLAGIGLFLFGMFQLEDAMKQIEGRTFKLFLKKHTKNKLSAILSGTFVTGLLQSSSVVNLVLLSFVGAGMITMRSALAVILGSNVGGTFNSWLLVAIGFKINISSITLPIIALAGIGLIASRKNNRLYKIFNLFMGYGLLFLGLEFTKESMQFIVKDFDFSGYLNYSRIVFVIAGFVVTSLIQTSAATVVIVLSALYAKVIPIEMAVSIVLGAELGTTVKVLLGSIGGIPAKKRVAFANTFFNVTTSAFGFLLMTPILIFLKNEIGLTDPLLLLVSFQTLINIAGVFFFYFFLNGFALLLEKYIANGYEKKATTYLPNAMPDLPGTAQDMLEKEVDLFIDRVIVLNMEAFQLKENEDLMPAVKISEALPTYYSYTEKYGYLKLAEGEILTFFSKIGEEKMEKENFMRIHQLMSAVRNAMYSAKGMKDIVHDRKEFSNSASDIKYNIYNLFRTQLAGFYTELTSVRLIENKTTAFEALAKLLQNTKNEYERRMQSSYKHAGENALDKMEIATLFNINREIYSSCKALILAVKDYKLDQAAAENFENIPV